MFKCSKNPKMYVWHLVQQFSSETLFQLALGFYVCSLYQHVIFLIGTHFYGPANWVFSSTIPSRNGIKDS